MARPAFVAAPPLSRPPAVAARSVQPAGRAPPPPPPPPRMSAQPRRPAAVAAAAAAAAAIIALGGVQPEALGFAERHAPAALTPAETNVVELFNTAAKSVVNVTTYSDARQGFSLNQAEVPVGAGSGFIYGRDGFIVTNYHVIRNASGAKVTLANRKTYDARLRGYDADKDIAVLQIDALRDELVPIAIGTSSDLVVGQSTYAIGNPFGLDHSLTSGVLSGLGRDMKSPSGRLISNCIQTDAASNPGNSGGPLLRSNGDLIGMNTSIYSPSGASAGIGFAIPVDTITQIADSLIANGKIIRPVLGISYLESSQARALGVERGVLVLSVVPGSSAEAAGVVGTSRSGNFGSLQLGDVVTAIDGEKLMTEADLFRVLESHKVGDKVRVDVTNPRDGDRSLEVKLGASSQE